MNWFSLFAKNENISPDEARKYLDSSPPGSLQLVDVRQPGEYQQSHIPGAKLIPLGELPDRLDELDPNKETIVYCRSGVRSRAGSQILSKANFSQVLNMTGGIIGWQGYQASGEEELGLEFFLDADFSSASQMAFAMEVALKQLYMLLAERTDIQENKQFLTRLATFEDSHMAKLRAQYPALATNATIARPAPAEGGIEPEAFLARYSDQLIDIESIIQAGMMFEAQAYDMYNRLADKTDESELKDFYLKMAAEEKTHLQILAKELNKQLN
ncbi:rhodanese-like domain-containing protein [Desulfosediminicola sp.]|uniref:rhodanese-like domain-containing protein n=1 Tax=Desulfosediminicola sp. TaxID=2886825 RepID=UPI003AF2352E